MLSADRFTTPPPSERPLPSTPYLPTNPQSLITPPRSTSPTPRRATRGQKRVYEDEEPSHTGDEDFSLGLSAAKKRKGKGEPTQGKGKGKCAEVVALQVNSARCIFFECPAKILDLILSQEILRVPEHLALAGTCRSLRSCYYSPPKAVESKIWEVLLTFRPQQQRSFATINQYFSRSGWQLPTLNGIWSRKKVNPEKMQILRCDPELGMVAIRGGEWEKAILAVQYETITKTEARRNYKVSEKGIMRLPHRSLPNPHSPRRGEQYAPMLIFVDAAVQKLAMKEHGGFVNHIAKLKKCKEMAAKKRANKEAKLFNEDDY